MRLVGVFGVTDSVFRRPKSSLVRFPRPFLLCACVREGRKGLVNVYIYIPPSADPWVNAKGVRMQLGLIITQLGRTRVKKRAREVPTTTMESAINSAVSKVALETFEAEAREATAAFVSGNDIFVSLPTGYGKSFCYVLFRRAVAKEWFHCAFTLLLAGVSLISSLTVVTMRFIAHLFNRNRVKHAT